ncbi:MAG TPA: type II secretion system protein GspC [Polyangia bacterium]|nr:type II secretion system protein GspC [Polyangia bacterium]
MDVVLKKYFWVINLVVIGICATFAGRAAAHFLEGAYLTGSDDATRFSAPRRSLPPPAARVHGKDNDAIIKRDVFCSGCTPIEVKPPQPGDGPQSADVKTTLPLELVSTMVCPSDELWSMAVIRDLSTKEKDPGMYNRGSKIGTTEALVHKVLTKRVYIKNAGRLEYLELDGAAPPPAAAAPPPVMASNDPADIDPGKAVSCSGNSCNIERQFVEKMLSNTAALATAARFVPSIKDGKPNGFKLYAIRPNSIFGRIGLQNGDTIKAINGMDMSSPDKALEIYTKLRSASHLSVAVERRGENTTLDYSIR